MFVVEIVVVQIFCIGKYFIIVQIVVVQILQVVQIVQVVVKILVHIFCSRNICKKYLP